MSHIHAKREGPETRGVTIHWAKWYDRLSLWQVLTLGRGVRVWTEMLDKAELNPGDRVLDVGCGPGALTLKAKERVGVSGEVSGIDASPEMIDVAREKSKRAGVQVDYRLELVEKLPFPDGNFDAVLSSLMMHHLPDDLKRQGLAEICRVLKPGGRVVIVDFKRPESHLSRALLPGMMHRSMPVGIQDLSVYLEAAGFVGVELSDTQVNMFGCLRGAKRQ